MHHVEYWPQYSGSREASDHTSRFHRDSLGVIVHRAVKKLDSVKSHERHRELKQHPPLHQPDLLSGPGRRVPKSHCCCCSSSSFLLPSILNKQAILFYLQHGRPAQIAIWLPGSLPDVRIFFLFFLYCFYMFLSGK